VGTDDAGGQQHVAQHARALCGKQLSSHAPPRALAAQAADQLLGARQLDLAHADLLRQTLLLCRQLGELRSQGGQARLGLGQAGLLGAQLLNRHCVSALGGGAGGALGRDLTAHSVVKLHGADPLAQTVGGNADFLDHLRTRS
jgi:hypothetical protein